MRRRSLIALPAIAALALVFTGCAAGSPSPSSSSSGSASLCSAAAPSGAASDGVTATGAVGQKPEVKFSFPLTVPEFQRTVLVSGSGDPAAEKSYVNYALSAYNGTTGEFLDGAGYAPGEILPAQLKLGTGYASVFGCEAPGARIAFVLPDSSGTGFPVVYVLDYLSNVKLQATGAPQPAVAGMPAVTLDANGVPTVTIPAGAPAPSELQLATLKKGDGIVVQPNAQVLVQYKGVKWSDGTEFDSSWSRNEPTPMQISQGQLIDGFIQAIQGQTVGSQVIAVLPPSVAYGASEGNALQKETLVFVIDILAVQNPPQS